MQVGHSRGRDGISRLNYRCLNKECTREKGYRSIRGKVVFAEIIKLIEEQLVSLRHFLNSLNSNMVGAVGIEPTTKWL